MVTKNGPGGNFVHHQEMIAFEPAAPAFLGAGPPAHRARAVLYRAELQAHMNAT